MTVTIINHLLYTKLIGHFMICPIVYIVYIVNMYIIYALLKFKNCRWIYNIKIIQMIDVSTIKKALFFKKIKSSERKHFSFSQRILFIFIN